MTKDTIEINVLDVHIRAQLTRHVEECTALAGELASLARSIETIAGPTSPGAGGSDLRTVATTVRAAALSCLMHGAAIVSRASAIEALGNVREATGAP